MNIYVVKDYNDLLYVGHDEEEAKKSKLYVSIWRDGKQVGSIIWHPVEGWKKRLQSRKGLPSWDFPPY